jgi:Bifunctional DNA primase/polymerase, N-terminal/Protein of unknown function (DUF3987)/Primase C terminal 1 (PriCT-1)
VITTREVFQPYRDAGICALPVQAHKKSPLVVWKQYQDRLPTGEEYEKWINEYKLVGVFIVCGSVSGVVALDLDNDAAIERADREIGAEILDVTTCVSTSKGRRHYYFTIPAGEVIPSWSEDGYELHAEGKGVVAPPSLHRSGVGYRFIRGLECMQPLPEVLRHRNGSNEHAEGGAAPKVAKDGLASLLAKPPAEGDRNTWLTKVCGHLAKQHAFKDGYLATVDLANKSLKTPLPAGEVEKTAASIWDAEQRQSTKCRPFQRTEVPKPTPLGSPAFHGPLGAFVKAWEPHTEADPAALLATALVGFSSVLGSGPRHTVSGDVHAARLWACVVGSSATARKGMSYKPARNLLASVDPLWNEICNASGLSTGEGLIHRVRDLKIGTKTDSKSGQITEYVEDPGITDKRLFLLEAEFARVLTVMARKDNTLSTVMRELWDRGDAQIITKVSAATATDAHVCLIAHVTMEELRRALSDCDAANGFANRFLWVYAERHGSLPFGGAAEPKELEQIRESLERAYHHAPPGEVGWSEDAKALWVEKYEDLLKCGGGLTGSIVARGQPQVLRLALVYALADDVVEIGRVHLEAALEVWRYCAESARYIFGERTGDTAADRILVELRERGQMTRNEIRELFDRHKSSTAIGAALEALRAAGLAESEKAASEGGRPAEVWSAC